MRKTYVFNLYDGKYCECLLMSGHGDKITVLVDGRQWKVNRWLVSKDPADIKRLRMAWEKEKAKIQQSKPSP